MKQELEQLLAQNETFMVEGVLNKNKLAELARQYNPELLNILMSNGKISKHFFSTLDTGVLVFKKDVFLQFLNNKEFLPDSFTAYKTKIGLATGDKYLSENQEVVLNFPYKDCVLEGGQTKDDAKRQEIFFNETLAPTEINRLLDDKVLTNFRRYDQEGEHEVEELSDTDNLIIKGNNLIALHSLKKRFAGKIKLIYIDPPYNTGKDSFGYNDRFNHSSWLTFIKNRLEIAWELLADDGTIWISIDDYESHYLKVLADGIFGRENFVNEVIWQRAYAPVNLKKTFSRSHDAILVYAKNNSSEKEFNRIPRKESMVANYKNPDNDPRGVYKADNFSVGPAVEKNIYEITTPSGRKVLPPDGYSWRFSKERFEELLADNRVYFGKDGNSAPSYKRFLSEVKDGVVAQTLWTYQEVGHNQDAKKEIKSLFDGQAAFGTPKPEKLIQRVLQIGSNENDLVLDFFMGSATTQSVAHKMNRQYIGIEQMDYIETVSVERLKKVIAGEQGGISKDVNWSGGGSFVYAELKNDAQDFKNAIFEATTTEELLELFELAKKSSFLSYRIDPKKLKKNEFSQLSLAEQKQILSEIIDNNNLYVNYSDIDDSDYQISAEDRKLNHSFYGKEK
ncbi:site-specific DNA-methyltransferase [Streptococcus suis]|uniref:DNA methyltransferase n=1 Tax=Streptococcus suis TaxID=1307 RepID=UPI0038B81441